jgi:NADH:ubiquinone oxidoreductase subunit 6 (subunit J)
MIGVALLMIAVAAAVGVCAWVDMVDRIWLVAGVGAAMVALLGVQTMLPGPTTEAARYFPIWFVGTFLVALTLNIVAVFVGRAVKRRQDSGSPQQP